MYSPKISEELVPVLYRLAKERRMPMTHLVDDLIRQALASVGLPELSSESEPTALAVSMVHAHSVA